MQESVDKKPLIVAILFLLLLGAVFAFLTNKKNTVSPIPEEGLRIIFVSPMPSETPSVAATPSATSKPKASPTAAVKPKASPTATASPVSPTATPKPTPIP